jgi:hypothetical protein
VEVANSVPMTLILLVPLRNPLDRQPGKAAPARGAESVGCPEILRKIMAPMSQWAPCSPPSRRIVRNETGSDPRGQYCAKYRVQRLSKG